VLQPENLIHCPGWKSARSSLETTNLQHSPLEIPKAKKMSDSSPVRASDKETAPYIEKEPAPLADKETNPHNELSEDVERADHGILVKAAPLARELKGRHMQMIAIGEILLLLPEHAAYSSPQVVQLELDYSLDLALRFRLVARGVWSVVPKLKVP
jgi:hypothetical protein